MAVGAALMAGCAPGGDFPAVDAGVVREEARKQRGIGAEAGDLPFGFDIKKHPETYGFCEKGEHRYILNSWRCSAAPRPHPAFEYYVIQYVEGIGACAIWGIGKSVSDDSFGHETRKIVDVLSGQLATKYGKGRKWDFLKDGSTLNEPEEWLKGIERGDRRYGYVWEPIGGFEPVGNVEFIEIRARASVFLGYYGYVHLLFHLKTFDECEKKIKEEAAKSF